MSECLISVIMPIYNTNPHFLHEAVKSILDQTHKNIELILIDDCSDNYLFDLPIFQDRRITIIKNKINLGPSASRNIGLKISKGKYIAIMDSDDICIKTRLEKQCRFLEKNPNHVVCASWYKTFGSSNREERIDISDFEYYKCCLLFENKPTILHSSVMFRASALKDNGIYYDEGLKYGEDYKMWIRLSRIGSFHIIKDFLVHYRTHEDQLCFATTNLETKRECRIKIKKWNICFLSWDSFVTEKDILNISYPLEKSTKSVSLIKTLRRIKKANKQRPMFDAKKLKKRVGIVWKAKIEEINNPFTIICLSLINLSTFTIKTRQLFRKIINKQHQKKP